MLRNRNLDIAIAAIVAILGGLAAAKHLPGQVTIPLGLCLFFAPGYLWSEAILSHEMPGYERAMFSAGMAFIFPILGGFLFFGLHIPLFRSSWIGLLVVLTLLGVVATAVQRLRQLPEDQRQQRRSGPPRQAGSLVLHSSIFGLAALIGLGAIGYSVKSAEAQKFPGYTMFSMTPVVNNTIANNMALLSNNATEQNDAAVLQNQLVGSAKQAHIYIADHEGVPEKYKVELYRQGKLTSKWSVSLNDGQSWQKTIAYTQPTPTATSSYEMLADLYTLPNTTTPSNYVNNGACVSNIKLLPANIRSEDPCYVKPKS